MHFSFFTLAGRLKAQELNAAGYGCLFRRSFPALPDHIRTPFSDTQGFPARKATSKKGYVIHPLSETELSPLAQSAATTKPGFPCTEGSPPPPPPKKPSPSMARLSAGFSIAASAASVNADWLPQLLMLAALLFIPGRKAGRR